MVPGTKITLEITVVTHVPKHPNGKQNKNLGNGMWKVHYPDHLQKTVHAKYLGGVLKFLVIFKAYLEGKNLRYEKWLFLTQGH